ncbi:hypothetical protein FOZ76_25825 [Verticiella sediminum]|uniref:SnoaL-like domain-containing protein n=1 Tax=Verticiella sediminum TaxID=1247510 RepID=A0A556A832_9BURK|nr:nuclear transport factor 2 family protein [Verticiella sediminum]TSH89037.1 hypothetical protein FOZ76_25825 [Verticiella sediminum]
MTRQPNATLVRDFATWAAVNEALQGYADALDRADLDALLSFFDPQARWIYSPTAEHKGHGEIRSFFEERLSVFQRTSHNVSPPVVHTLPDSELLQSTAYFVAEHQLVDAGRYRVFGRYIDKIRIQDGMAMICERSVLAHVTEGTDRTYRMLQRNSA